jgi:hypothetical protein
MARDHETRGYEVKQKLLEAIRRPSCYVVYCHSPRYKHDLLCVDKETCETEPFEHSEMADILDEAFHEYDGADTLTLPHRHGIQFDHMSWVSKSGKQVTTFSTGSHCVFSGKIVCCSTDQGQFGHWSL